MTEINTTLHILLADDDEDDCLIFKDVIEGLQLPVQFTMVPDGEELMLYLETASSLPHALFLDLNMPCKNGFECLTEIKKHAKLKMIPVIIYSTSYDEEKANQLYKAGAHYYICKPSDFEELKKVIYQAITLIKKEKNVQPPKEIFLLSNLKSILF